MNKNQEILAVVGLIVIVLAVWLIEHRNVAAPTTDQGTAMQVSTTRAHFACDNGKFIDASFTNGTTTVAVAGQPPVPTGTVDVSLSGGATSTLHQTISADGARYANTDESFVFWNKGNEALIMRNNSMDLTYTNCVAPKG